MARLFRITLVLAATLVALAGAAAAGIENVHDQFTIELPEGWTVYDQTAAITGQPGPYGMVFFSAEPVLSPGETMPSSARSMETLRRIGAGDVPSFFVDRHQAGRGMSCSKLTRNARNAIELMVGGDPIFGGLARQLLLPKRPQTSLIELGGCQALKLEGRGRVGPEKTEWILDVRAVSDGKTLYLFGLRNLAENFARNRGGYEAALATLRISPESAGASGATAAKLASFDGRAWKQGYAGRTPDMEITEYVLPGEVVEAWTELFTVQRTPGAGDRMGPLEAMTRAKEGALGECPSAAWTVVRQEKEEVVYHAEHRRCRGLDDELEVAKLYRDGSSLVRVAWSARKLPVPEETLAKWIKFVGEYRDE